MSERAFNSGAMRILKPGEVAVITYGSGVPGKGLPKKCFKCRKAIKAGEAWRSTDNLQYTIIQHRDCGE